jgi:hypothetical protein
MRQVLICLLIFVAVFNSGSVRTREAQANPAIVLVPEAAVGMLFLLAAGCTAAYEMGTITRAQNDDYQRDLHEKIDAIQNAVRRALDTTGEAVMKAVATMIYIQSVIHSPYICEQKLLKVADSFSSSQKTTEARKSAVGECRPDLRGNPYNCCPNFMSKFGKGNDMSKIGENSFRVSYLNGIPCMGDSKCTRRATTSLLSIWAKNPVGVMKTSARIFATPTILTRVTFYPHDMRLAMAVRNF